jgi:hypothetical protein
MRILILSVFLTFGSLVAIAQSSYTGGVHLEVKPSFSFKNNWKLNGRVGSRILFFEGSRDQSFNWISDYERTELELVLTKKASAATSWGGGYLIRNQKEKIKHRLIQQFSISNTYGSLNLGHRFRFDETFQKDEATEYRFRYRIGLEKPLQSKNGKTYVFLNNEYIPSLQDKQFEMELRLLPGMGFRLNESNKLEAGIDFRVENLFKDSHKQVYLLYLSWSPSF